MRKWVPLSDPTPSAVHDNGTKWVGPTWAHIDENLVLRFTPTKTEFTTGLPVIIDLSVCPMVELQRIPVEERCGPLIVNPDTGFPYRSDAFGDVWRDVAKLAGIPPQVWNRDLRKSGSTEARQAGAPIDDVKKLMGHSANSETTARVYDLAALEAQRRIAAARNANRRKK
jgi:integrase